MAKASAWSPPPGPPKKVANPKADRSEVLKCKAEMEAAYDWFVSRPEGEEQKDAFADLKTAQRAYRRARRAAGDLLIQESDRRLPVNMGQLEDLLFVLHDRIRKLEERPRGKR